MKLNTSVPYAPLPELARRFEAFLATLCREAHAYQQVNQYRARYVDLQQALPAAWVDPNYLPLGVPTGGVHHFCIYGVPPCPAVPCGEWVLFGGVERVVLCNCGKSKSGRCEHPLVEPAEAYADACERCRCRVFFEVHPFFPLSEREVMAAFERFFEPGQEVVGSAITVHGTAVTGRGQAVRALGRRRGPPPLESTLALLAWMEKADNPQKYAPFCEAWKRIRRTEQGWDELTDPNHAFDCVAKRCLARIYGPVAGQVRRGGG